MCAKSLAQCLAVGGKRGQLGKGEGVRGPSVVHPSNARAVR